MAKLAENVQDIALKALGLFLGKKKALTESEVEALLTGENPDSVVADTQKRIAALRSEGNKAGMGKMQKAAEAKVAELFGLDLDELPPADAEKGRTIEELIDVIHEHYKAEPSEVGNPAELTEEQVKAHPAFKTLEKNYREKDKTHKRELKEAEDRGELKAGAAELKADALRYRGEFKAIPDAKPQIAKAQEALVNAQLEGVVKKTDEYGEVELWKNGKRIEGKDGLPVSVEDFFRGIISETYVTQVSEQKDSTGLDQDRGQQQQQQNSNGLIHFKGTLPKSEDEYNTMKNDRIKYNVDERAELVSWWSTNKDKISTE